MEKPKKHSPILFIFACLMIGVGVVILLYPIVGNRIAEHRRRQSVEIHHQELENTSTQLLEYYRERAEQFNEFIYRQQQGLHHEYIHYDSLRDHDLQVMGTVDVPSLGVRSLPFYHGTSVQVLDRGLGHFEPSTIPIGGDNTRAVITGHSGVHNQILFSEISLLQPGDIFFINILGERLAYVIEDKEEILPTDIDRVGIRSGEDMVTLLTCTPPGINTYRLLVNGFRIPYDEAIQREVAVRNFWSYERVVLGSLTLIILLFIVSYARYRQLRKRSLSDDPVKAAKGAKKLKGLLLGIKMMFALLLLATIVVLGFAVYGYLRMQQSPQLESLNIGVQGEVRNYNSSKIIRANYDERQIASVNVANLSQALVATYDTVNDWGIGKILLPDVEIDLPILAGIANINLLTGGSTYRMTQQLGRGNYVLLAHSIYGNERVLFQPLYRVQIGNRIYATDFQNVYIYEVTFNQVIHDSQVEFLEEIEAWEIPIITLMRCEGGIGTRYRRVVQGEFVGVEPLNPETLEAFNLVKEEHTSSIPALLTKDPIARHERLSMMIAARIISDPIQVGVPLFLLLLFPILFLSILPLKSKKIKGARL